MPRFPLTPLLLVCLTTLAGCYPGPAGRGTHTGSPGTPPTARLPDREAVAKLLPPGVQLDTVAECEVGGANKRTVEEELIRVRARVGGDGKLHDAAGKPIEFFHLTGCWGNPPADYQQILAEEGRRLEELRKTHTVITLTCNPTGQLIP